MYVNAFDHDFYAIEKPDDCVSKRISTYWPQNFKMGYMEPRKAEVSGELFAQTSRNHPFNIIPNSNASDNQISRDLYQRDSVLDVQVTSSNVLQRLREKILKYVFLDPNFR